MHDRRSMPAQEPDHGEETRMLTATKRNPAARVVMALIALLLIVAGFYFWM